jgi:hypothetical protein
VRVVAQTLDAVHMAAFELTTDFREVWVAAGAAYVPQIAIAPWNLRFNRFGPRRGGVINASAHDGVRPSNDHGSSVT